MLFIDWRRNVERALDLHQQTIRSPQSEVEAKRRVEMGGDLHRLVAWTRHQLQEVQNGARQQFEHYSTGDPAWVARLKIQLRGALDYHHQKDDLKRFLRLASDHLQTWETRSKELLGGTPPPKVDLPPAAIAPAKPAAPAAAPAPAPKAAAPAPTPAPTPAPAPKPAASAAEPVKVEIRPEPAAEPVKVESRPAPPAASGAPGAPGADDKNKKGKKGR